MLWKSGGFQSVATPANQDRESYYAPTSEDAITAGREYLFTALFKQPCQNLALVCCVHWSRRKRRTQRFLKPERSGWVGENTFNARNFFHSLSAVASHISGNYTREANLADSWQSSVSLNSSSSVDEEVILGLRM